MRTFIAIEISEEIKAALGQIESHLKYVGADVKWVLPQNIHLTLKFLGEIDEEKLQQVKDSLEEIAAVSRPFEINVKDIGAFPKIEYPRVIWVGLDKGAEESKHLAALVDEAMSRLGFDKESRPFEPHLTIGRVRSSKNKDKLAEKIRSVHSQQSIVHSSHIVSSAILFKSTLTPQGSIYTKLHEAKFPQ